MRRVSDAECRVAIMDRIVTETIPYSRFDVTDVT